MTQIQYITVLCNQCNGTGKLPMHAESHDGMIFCPYCKGRGFVQKRADMVDDDDVRV